MLCLGYKGELIKDYFRNYLWHTCDTTLRLGPDPEVQFHTRHKEEAWTVTLADTGQDTMTAGRLKRIQQYIGEDETFLFTYGDGVGNVDIEGSLKFHRDHGKLLTLTAVHPPSRFGEISLDDDGAVREFNEKPQAEDAWINGGYFVANRGIFDYLDDSDGVMFEQEPVKKIAADDQLRSRKHTGFWQPMDTYREFLLLNHLWDEGRAPWKTW